MYCKELSILILNLYKMAKRDGSKNVACNDAIQTLCEVFKKLVDAGCLTEAQEISRVM